ncbi:MAG: hypothetical protein LBE50_01155 [Gallionellaceae bacterium]|jgi:tetratricopeptide (TPR) repeat protein|nr:hypothetical protein [Gallionellaceae bacterium]
MKVKKTSREKIFRRIGITFALASALGFPLSASAQLIDSISVRDGGDVVIYTINMTTQVHYLRHTPTTQGRTLDIYYQLLPGASPGDLFEANEMRNSPPSEQTPSFVIRSKQDNNQNDLAIVFSSEAEYTVLPGKDFRSFHIAVRKTAPVGGESGIGGARDVPEIPAVSAAEESAASADEKRARELMIAGRDGLVSGDYPAAVGAFNKLLSLPPNRYTQDAQEWIGVARERAGQRFKAKLEYETYLQLYPDGAGAARVKERLAKVSIRPAVIETLEGAGEKRAAETQVFGGVSSYYNYSASDISSPTGSVSAKDLSSQLTAVDFSARYRGETYDNRLVFRGSHTQNYLAGQSNDSKISSAYVDVRNMAANYTARIGRQSPVSDGIMGRFDGITASYGFKPDWQAGVAAGRLADVVQDEKPVFAGAKLGVAGGAGSPWSGSVYLINQTAGGLSDRQAVGTEIRYFDLNRVAYLLVDYDTSYAALNTVLLQASMTSPTGTIYHVLLDHRKNISTSNALIGSSTTSLSALASATSKDYVRQLAEARTLTTDLVQAGFTYPVSEKWQVSADIGMTRDSGMPASGATALEGILAATPANSTSWNLTAQLIGNSVIFAGDITLFGLTRDQATNTTGLYVTNHVVVKEKWTLDSGLRVLNGNPGGGTLTQYQPSLKLAYQAWEALSLEAELGVDRSNDHSISTRTNRKYATLGFRWVF